MKKAISFIVFILFILSSFGCKKGDTNTTTNKVDNTTKEQIIIPEENADFSLSRDEIVLVQFNQTYIQIIGKNKDDAVWKSSNESVATVIDGVVTAHNEGNAVITATINGHSKSCNVIVNRSNDYPQLILNQYEATILVDDEFSIISSLLFRGENVSTYSLEVEVVDSNILTVEVNEFNIVINPKNVGITNVFVTATYNEMKTVRIITIKVVN